MADAMELAQSITILVLAIGLIMNAIALHRAIRVILAVGGMTHTMMLLYFISRRR